MMEKNDCLEKGTIVPGQNGNPIPCSTTGILSRAGRPLKKLLIITGFAAIGFTLNSCTTGYVAAEPTYIEYTRPARPSEFHIWVDGDWRYNRVSHTYVQKSGYWSRPSNNRTYISGHWQSSPKGKKWSSGHWQHNHR